jgi:hypothetical protein
MEYKICKTLSAKHVLPQLANTMVDGEYSLLMIGFAKGVVGGNGTGGLSFSEEGSDGNEIVFVNGGKITSATNGRGLGVELTIFGGK